jgi:hypothetical protein
VPKAGALPGYASSWTLAGTGGQISWKQQSIQSSDRENDPPFRLVLINTLVLTDPINSETIVSKVLWSAAGRNGLNRQTPQKRGSGK